MEYLTASVNRTIGELKLVRQEALTTPVDISTNSIPVKETYEDYFDPNFPRWLTVALFIIGLFGNTLSIGVFCQPKMRKNSTFIYLAFLCIVDLFVILLGLGDIILITYFKFIIRNQSLSMCRIHTFFTYTFTHLSSFVLASVSIDRAIATNLINFAKMYCKPTMANKVILFNVLLSILFNFHNLIFLGYQEDVEESLDDIMLFGNGTSASSNQTIQTAKIIKSNCHCAPKENSLYEYFIDPYYQWLDLILYAILPFIVMAVSTFFIIRVLFRSNKRMAKTLRPNAEKILSKHQRQQEGETNKLLTSNSKSGESQNTKKQQNTVNSNQNARLNKTLHLTYTLITINTLFFCLVSPLAIVYILVKGKESIQNNKILINIVYLLAYSNHSFNFIFYGLSSPPYRETIFDFIKRIKGICKKPEVISRANTSTASKTASTKRI